MTLEIELVSLRLPAFPFGGLLFGALLVGAAQDKLELVGWDADSVEDGIDAELVVGGAVVDELNRSLEVVKEAMAVTGLAEHLSGNVRCRTCRREG